MRNPSNTTYEGRRHPERGAEVFIVRAPTNRRPLPLCLNLRNHSPDGFEWGYGGSGPAQLALAMCYHALICLHGGATPELAERAQRVYQDFKFAYVGRFARETWRMSQAEVLRAIVAIEDKKAEVHG